MFVVNKTYIVVHHTVLKLWSFSGLMRNNVFRGFSSAGDVAAAFEAVARSAGLERTRELAHSHSQERIMRRRLDTMCLPLPRHYAYI